MRSVSAKFVRPIMNSIEPNSDLKINFESEEYYSAQNSRAKCSDSSGGDRPVSHEEGMVFDAQLLLSSFHAPQDPCRAFVILEPWSGKKHGEILSSRWTMF